MHAYQPTARGSPLRWQRCGSTGAGKVFREMASGGNPVQLWRLQAEARRRRAEGATLAELARSYNVGISTIRRATRAA